jgi:hypothetical protein
MIQQMKPWGLAPLGDIWDHDGSVEFVADDLLVEPLSTSRPTTRSLSMLLTVTK